MGTPEREAKRCQEPRSVSTKMRSVAITLPRRLNVFDHLTAHGQIPKLARKRQAPVPSVPPVIGTPALSWPHPRGWLPSSPWYWRWESSRWPGAARSCVSSPPVTSEPEAAKLCQRTGKPKKTVCFGPVRRAMAFTTLMLFQLFDAFNAQSAAHSAFRGLFRNRRLWAAVSLSVALHTLGIYVQFLQAVFGTVRLDSWGQTRPSPSRAVWCGRRKRRNSRRNASIAAANTEEPSVDCLRSCR